MMDAALGRGKGGRGFVQVEFDALTKWFGDFRQAVKAKRQKE